MIDNELNFSMHLLNIIETAIIKFSAFTRVKKYMTTEQKIFFFSKSQFICRPVVWMFAQDTL